MITNEQILSNTPEQTRLCLLACGLVEYSVTFGDWELSQHGRAVLNVLQRMEEQP